MLKTYRFTDKDPIIDVLRTAIQDYAAIENIKFSTALSQVAEGTGISLGTLYNWFSGPTRYPQYRSIAAVVIFLRLRLEVGVRSRNLQLVHKRA